MALFATSMWAETTETITVVSNGSSTSSAPLKDKSNSASGTTLTGCTVSIEWTANTSSSISSKYYAQIGDNSSAVDNNYFKVSVNSGYKINSIKFYLSNNQSSDKDTDYGILAWDDDLTPALTNPSYAATGAVFTTKKGTIKEQIETFTSLEGVQVNDVRMYRKISGVTYGGKTNQAYGAKGVTLYIQKVDVTVEELPVCPSGLTISGAYHTYAVGEEIELTASLTAGNGTITYQWYKGGTEESNKLIGKTSSTLNIASCVDGDAGDYYCVASKTDCGSAVNAQAYAISVQETVDKYTVVYKDGDDELDSEIVIVGEHPVGIEEPTKNYFSFASWQQSGSDIDLEDVSGTKDAEITLTVRWAPKYATTADFAAVVTAGTTASNPIATFLANHNMYAAGLSSSLWETSTGKSGYVGYKLKDEGAVVSFQVQGGKQVTITLGSVGAKVTLSKGGVTSEIPASSGNDAETVVPAFVPAADMIVSLTTSSTSTVTLKKIAIENSATALDNTADELKAVKRIENGQLVIEKNGVRYNAQGQIVR